MTIHKYVYLQGENVIAVLSYDDEDSYSAGIASALDSGAIFVEVDENNPADQFWTWDGVTATSPDGEIWTGVNNG